MKHITKHDNPINKTSNKPVKQISKQKKHETNQYTQSTTKGNMKQINTHTHQIKQT